MKILPILTAVLAPFLTLANAQQNVILVEEDFETGGTSVTTGNNGASRTLVADPAAGGTNGTVAAVDLSGSSQWGAFDAAPTRNIPLPLATTPGTDSYVATFDVYIDSANTTFNVGENLDRVNMILRFNRGTDDGSRVEVSSSNAWESIPLDQWVPITKEDVIPAVDQDGTPISHVLPIISFRDQGAADGGVEAVAGIAAYFDNFRLEVTIPDEDPNLGAAPVHFGEVVQGEGPFVHTVPISNSGAMNTLTVTGVTLTGANAASFTVTNTVFPLEIGPGETEDVELTFDPGAVTGTFVASLDIASNDQGDPTVSLAVNATVSPPFEGLELIVNGDFENWRPGRMAAGRWALRFHR